MASEQKEQYERFEQVISPYINSAQSCKNCPIQEKCWAETTTTEDIQHTCEETLWHYIQTGEFLL